MIRDEQQTVKQQTDEQQTDEQQTDEQQTDEQQTDEQQTDEQQTDKTIKKTLVTWWDCENRCPRSKLVNNSESENWFQRKLFIQMIIIVTSENIFLNPIKDEIKNNINNTISEHDKKYGENYCKNIKIEYNIQFFDRIKKSTKKILTKL